MTLYFCLTRLLTMCTRHFGSVVTQTIRTYKTDQFPLLLIVMGKRTSNEVLNVIQGKCDDAIIILSLEDVLTSETICANWNLSGNTTVDELMMRLMGAMEIFTAQQLEDIKDEVRFVFRTYSASIFGSPYRLRVEPLLNLMTRNWICIVLFKKK